MNKQNILREVIASNPIEVSAPCRIDMGGTLDIRTFYLPLRQFQPCTFNIAIDIRTRVRLHPFDQGYIKISSRGFDSAVYASDNCPFDTPLGLMFAIACYFGADGVHIDIASASPPRSALGGSSAAAVALVSAFNSVFVQAGLMKSFTSSEAALLAHELEESVAGVPCGLQDQLAAVYGGVNAWYWPSAPGKPPFTQKTLLNACGMDNFEKRLLIAYAGMPHESKNINSRWVQQFIAAETRMLWREIAGCSHKFVEAINKGDYSAAIEQMNRDTSLRCQMTPDVLDEMGQVLVQAALEKGCGARFTGAGGGGCIWALGEIQAIEDLRGLWLKQLKSRGEACLLDFRIAKKGLETK
jgi:D-glycero-alpha-D-manno-heptose-7-phosphate kinase